MHQWIFGNHSPLSSWSIMDFVRFFLRIFRFSDFELFVFFVLTFFFSSGVMCSSPPITPSSTLLTVKLDLPEPSNRQPSRNNRNKFVVKILVKIYNSEKFYDCVISFFLCNHYMEAFIKQKGNISFFYLFFFFLSSRSLGYCVLDGGLASELEHKGYDLKDSLWSAKFLYENPTAIKEVSMNLPSSHFKSIFR